MKIVFMGTPQAGVPSLKRLIEDGHEIVAIYTQPDRPSGRGKKIVFSPVKSFGIDYKLTVLQPQKIRTAEALETFRRHNADAAVVVAYGRILPETFLNAYPNGAINVHFSLLPKYRGAAPVNWAIVNGERVTGVTTMQMDAGLDTGDILLQQETEIVENETAIELTERLAEIGAALLSETIVRIDELPRIKQDEAKASFAPILKKSDGLIDWRISASMIAARVRGFQPFPTAFTFLGELRLTIWAASEVDLDKGGRESLPGEIHEASGDRFVVCCGRGTALMVEELQLEGKRRMTARDFNNGIRPPTATILGEKR
jgi:methionyl-tRNA formyltransferase